jgi:hypothetical protein
VDTGYGCKQILLIVPAKFCDHTHPGRRRQVANLGSHTLFLAGSISPLSPTFYRFSLEVIVLPCMGLILEILQHPLPLGLTS